MYDYSKLKGKIAEKGYTKFSLSKALQMHPNSLSGRLDNKLEFKQEDMVKICDILGIKHKDIPVYFFTIKL
jgi:lambda repressor-like predicted transcriptional regulator